MSDLTQPALTMSGFTSVSLLATPVGGDAEASIAISESFYTSGPVRQGFLVFDVINATGSNPFQFVTGRISVGNQQFGFGNGGAVPPPFTQFPFAEFPFTLGIESSFGMTVFGSAGEGCGCAFGPSLSAYAVADVSFQLLEADGVTPVMIEPVPEPSMFWPIATAFTLGWLLLRKRARRLCS
jgi:hypothetical protein